MCGHSSDTRALPCYYNGGAHMEVDKSLDSGEPYFHRDACNWNVQVFPASHCIYMMISLSPLALNHISW